MLDCLCLNKKINFAKAIYKTFSNSYMAILNRSISLNKHLRLHLFNVNQECLSLEQFVYTSTVKKRHLIYLIAQKQLRKDENFFLRNIEVKVKVEMFSLHVALILMKKKTN